MHFILISGDPTDESWLRMWPVCREIVPHADCISDVQIYSLASKGYLQGNKKGSKSENSSETCTQHLKGFGPLMNCWQCCHCSLCESHQKKWRKKKKTKKTTPFLEHFEKCENYKCEKETGNLIHMFWKCHCPLLNYFWRTEWRTEEQLLKLL